MATLLFSWVLILLSIGGLALGVVAGRGPLPRGCDGCGGACGDSGRRAEHCAKHGPTREGRP